MEMEQDHMVMSGRYGGQEVLGVDSIVEDYLKLMGRIWKLV